MLQSRVKASIDVVQAVQDLKTAIASLDAAIQKGDWEAATRAMQRARAIDPEIVKSGFAEAVVVRLLSPQSSDICVKTERGHCNRSRLRIFPRHRHKR